MGTELGILTNSIIFEIMKRAIIFLFLAPLLALLSACTEKEMAPVKIEVGDIIQFGSSLPNEQTPVTKTIYGSPVYRDDGSGYYPVYWETEGKDQVMVFCAQSASPNEQYATYRVFRDDTGEGTWHTSERLEWSSTEQETALQWGSADEHRFFGLYPAEKVDLTHTSVQSGKIYGEIEDLQNPVSWREEDSDNGGTRYVGEPNTDFAYMYAFNKVSKNTLMASGNAAVPLTFRPLVTLLDIVVNGPTEGSPVKVSSVNIRGVEGTNTILTGSFYCDLNPESGDDDDIGKCYIGGDTQGTVRNTITISCWNQALNDGDGDFISLGPGDQLVVRAFLLPYELDDNVTRTIQVRVSPVNSSVKTKTLEPNSTIPYKANQVALPPLTSGGNNYWMSSLDENIYLSELSLPGTKFSMLTKENGALTVYQNASIAEQYNAGIRAFIIQTGADCNTNNTNWSPINNNDRYFVDGELYVSVNDSRLSQNNSFVEMETILKQLGECIKNTDEELSGKPNNEFVFVQLTYSSGATKINNDGSFYDDWGNEEAWIKTVEYKIKQYAQNKSDYVIFADEITPDTRIADVKGKIVLKLNYNTETMGNYIDSNSQIPALFSLWERPYVENGVKLRWGSPNVGNQPKLEWYYQEVTLVGKGDEVGGAEASYNQKINYAQTIFENSVDKYVAAEGHDVWFMNDLGGTYYPANTDNVKALTNDMVPWAQRQLQGRTENASLGLIYMNYGDNLQASGQAYGTANLIQTIIDNNFKFALRKSGTTAASAVSTRTSSSDGWDE